jgi:hypothetical protein
MKVTFRRTEGTRPRFRVLSQGGLASLGNIVRNAFAALLAVVGVTLIGLAVADWVGYRGFSLSLIWH